MASPQYRSHDEGAYGVGTSNTPTEPAGAASGDILLAIVYLEGTVTVTPPSGWSDTFNGVVPFENSTSEGPFEAHHYWIRRGGSAPAYNFSWSASAGYQIIVVAYSGAVATGDPWSFAAEAERDNTLAVTFPDVSGTTLTNDELLTWVGINYVGGVGGVVPTGFTSRSNIDSHDIRVATKPQAATGATGTVTGGSWTTPGGAAQSFLFGLQSVAAGGGSEVLDITITATTEVVDNLRRAPGNVVATPTGTATATVTWSAVSGATGYDIERNGSVIATNHSASPFNDTGLTPATSYDYRVRAVFA